MMKILVWRAACCTVPVLTETEKSKVYVECQLKGLLIFFDWFLVVANSEGEMANGSRVCNRSCNVCWSDGNG